MRLICEALAFTTAAVAAQFRLLDVTECEDGPGQHRPSHHLLPEAGKLRNLDLRLIGDSAIGRVVDAAGTVVWGASGVGIDPLPQFLAGPKMGNAFRRNLHDTASLRVAAHTRGPVIQAEASEAADLDSLSVGKRRAQCAKYYLDGESTFRGGQMRPVCGKPGGKFRASHGGILRRHSVPIYCFCCLKIATKSQMVATDL